MSSTRGEPLPHMSAPTIVKFYDRGSKLIVARGYDLHAFSADTLEPLWQHNFDKCKPIKSMSNSTSSSITSVTTSSSNPTSLVTSTTSATNVNSTKIDPLMLKEGILTVEPICQLCADPLSLDRGESTFAMIVTDKTQRGGGCKTVMIWNQKTKSNSKIAFRSSIYRLRLTPEYLIVVTEREIAIVSTTTLSVIKTIPTGSNKLGLVDIITTQSLNNNANSENTNSANTNTLLVVPGIKPGTWKVENLTKFDAKNSDVKETHAHDLSLLRFDSTGQLVVSASSQGTRMVVYNLALKTQYLFRRDKELTTFADATFHVSDHLFAVASGGAMMNVDVFTTRHLCCISNANISDSKSPNANISESNATVTTKRNNTTNLKSTRKNKNLAWGLLSVVGEYFNSEWGYAQYNFKSETNDDTIKSIAFLPIPNKVALNVVLSNNNFIRLIIDDSGKCVEDKRQVLTF